MAASQRRPFALVSRYRMTGVAYGSQRSLRRGQGAEVAGSRPYRPGDRLAWIDWHTSARLSLARSEDAFVVREYYAELAPRVVIVVDRRPSMALFGPDLPWLSKPEVLGHAATAIVAAARAARAYVGYLDFSGNAARTRDGGANWIAPHRQGASRILRRLEQEFRASPDTLEVALDYLWRLPSDVPAGSFVFVLSDFLRMPADATWARARARKWDLVPVVIQDPLWERSFPEVQGLLLPVTDPETGRTGSVRLTAREARARREANERRFAELTERFQRLRFDPVVLGTADPVAIDLAFIEWATRRQAIRGAAA